MVERSCVNREDTCCVLLTVLYAMRAQGYQHVYLAFLYGVLALKSVLLDDFASWAGGAIGDVRLARMTRLEAACFWGGKALYAAYFVAAPLAAGEHGWRALLALWLAAEVVAGYMLALMFQARSELSAFCRMRRRQQSVVPSST